VSASRYEWINWDFGASVRIMIKVKWYMAVLLESAIHPCGVGFIARPKAGETPVPQENIGCIGLNH
jgi:hypothetical protein